MSHARHARTRSAELSNRWRPHALAHQLFDIVVQYANGGRVEIIELSVARAPDKREDRHGDHQECQWQHNEEDTHGLVLEND